MGRPNQGGHVRRLKGFAKYRLIRVMVDGKSKQVLEHRHIMEQHIGRKLTQSEHIHHKDGNGLNNAIKNLEIMSPRAHQHHHLMGTRKWPCEEGAKLREQGWSTQAIAGHYGVSQSAVLSAFKARGICTKNKRDHQKPSWDVEAAKELRKQGENWTAIGRKMGVTATAIRIAFKRRGLI